jgi:hypothetical protein
MSALPPCFGRLLTAWNTDDLATVRALVESSLTDDVSFTDPDHKFTGIDRFIEQIEVFRRTEGTGRLVPTSGVDMHHDRARYSWALLRADGTRLDGFDVVALDLEQEKIARIDGFFGPLPPVGAANTDVGALSTI